MNKSQVHSKAKAHTVHHISRSLVRPSAGADPLFADDDWTDTEVDDEPRQIARPKKFAAEPAPFDVAIDDSLDADVEAEVNMLLHGFRSR
jgi:hypothetical protein